LCIYQVFNIDVLNRQFGEIVLTFNHKMGGLSGGGSKLLEGLPQFRELAEIAVCPINEDLVVLNIRRSNLVR